MKQDEKNAPSSTSSLSEANGGDNVLDTQVTLNLHEDEDHVSTSIEDNASTSMHLKMRST